MDVPILLPQLGTEVTEAEIDEWLAAEGAPVAEGAPLVVITTPKVTLEIEAPATGTLKAIAVPAGEIVEVGAVLGTIEAE